MHNKLKYLLGLAHREDATADELVPSLPVAEAELTAAREAQAAAEAAFRASLLIPDEAASNKLDVARREAGVRIERSEVLLSALRERLEEARAREAEADRVERYEAARRQGDEAADALRELYPQFAGGLVELLKAVAEAELAVKKANADLPARAVPLPGVEARVRDLPVLPEEVLEEVEVERWVRIGMTAPGAFDQSAVRPIKGNRGVLRVRGLPDDEGYPVERRRFVQRQCFPAVYHGGAERLAHELALPGFTEGDPELFVPVERPYQGAFDPIPVLRRIAELRAKAPRGEPIRELKTSLIPLDETPVKSLN